MESYHNGDGRGQAGDDSRGSQSGWCRGSTSRGEESYVIVDRWAYMGQADQPRRGRRTGELESAHPSDHDHGCNKRGRNEDSRGRPPNPPTGRRARLDSASGR